MRAGETVASWLFYAHNGLAEPALAEVFEACRGRNAVEPSFTRDDRAPIGPAPAVFAGREISVDAAGERTWDVVLATDNQRGERVPRGLRVRLPHGAAYGIHGYGIVSLGRCDLFVATSEAHRGFLERNRGLSGAETPVVVGGHPRLDRLWRERRDRDSVLQELGLDRGRPTVAISSHWTRDGNLRRLGAALPRAVLAALPEANVVQTGHPNLWQRVQYDIADPRSSLVSRALRRIRRELAPFDYDALFRDLGALAAAHARFRLVGPDRTFDALAAADVLVSDLSSLTVEFTLFDRPIVLHYPPGLEPYDRELGAAYLGASCPFRELDEAGPALHTALSEPAARRQERARLRDLCLDYRGCAGGRIVDLVLEARTEAGRSRVGTP